MKDIVNQKFGSLTVIGSAEPVIRSNGKKRIMVLCLCECNNTVVVRKDSLKRGDNTSCGCHITIKNKKIIRYNLLNKKFGKLLVIDGPTNEKVGVFSWKCLCDCGNIVLLNSQKLKTPSKSRSCGCDLPSKKEISAKRVYQHYKDGDISFDEFLKISFENCYYCGKAPYNIMNSSKYNVMNGSNEKNDPEYDFVFNGLDRKNNLLSHTKNNCVPCCWSCNRLKHLLNYDEFCIKLNIMYQRIQKDNKLYVNQCLSSDYILSKYDVSLCKYTYNDYMRRYKGNLLFEDFVKLISSNCYYCNALPSNKRNYKSNKDIIYSMFYNGLDRLDNNKPYDIDNVVPCCKSCNFMKGLDHFNDFTNKIINIYNFMNKNNIFGI